jgi:hypothetical protein
LFVALHCYSLIVAGQENQGFVAAIDDRVVSTSKLLLILLSWNVGIGAENENFLVPNPIIYEIKSFNGSVGVRLLRENGPHKMVVGLININRLILF